MLEIRLQRFGKKNSPSFRVVLTEHKNPPRGKFIEILGFYNPKSKEKNFKKEKIEYWLSKGVKTSPTVHNLLVNEGIIKGKKVRAWKPKRKPAVSPKEEKIVEEKIKPEIKPEEVKEENK